MDIGNVASAAALVTCLHHPAVRDWLLFERELEPLVLGIEPAVDAESSPPLLALDELAYAAGDPGIYVVTRVDSSASPADSPARVRVRNRHDPDNEIERFIVALIAAVLLTVQIIAGILLWGQRRNRRIRPRSQNFHDSN